MSILLACLVRQIKITHKHVKHTKEDRKHSDLKVLVRDTKLEVTSVPMLYLILSLSQWLQVSVYEAHVAYLSVT